jgi:hypothetical protein
MKIFIMICMWFLAAIFGFLCSIFIHDIGQSLILFVVGSLWYISGAIWGLIRK